MSGLKKVIGEHRIKKEFEQECFYNVLHRRIPWTEEPGEARYVRVSLCVCVCIGV